MSSKYIINIQIRTRRILYSIFIFVLNVTFKITSTWLINFNY
nr:MAG TPA: hypothetical protein [Caudoviricetes sp.]